MSEQTPAKFPNWLLNLLKQLNDPNFNVDDYLDTKFLKKTHPYDNNNTDINTEDKQLIDPIFEKNKNFLESIYLMPPTSTTPLSTITIIQQPNNKVSNIPEDKKQAFIKTILIPQTSLHKFVDGKINIKEIEPSPIDYKVLGLLAKNDIVKELKNNQPISMKELNIIDLLAAVIHSVESVTKDQLSNRAIRNVLVRINSAIYGYGVFDINFYKKRI